MRRENEERKKECENLRDLLYKEQEKLFIDLSRGTSEVRDLLEREQDNLRERLARHDAVSSLFKEELQKNKEDDQIGRSLLDTLKQQVSEMYSAVSKQFSVYFNAYRDEPYNSGGEEYLTFGGCSVNSGGNMDPKSGIFSVPVTGCYLFCLHVCTYDMKKALLSIRRNGVEIATLFDQNHVDNHKNSMAGQSILAELEEGDRIQVYMYTFTGLHDKAGNHMTQWLGLLVKPLSSLPESSKLVDKPRKRVIMSLE
ncbi:uncharacterized protein LOC111709908 [Eurytemora carolleeae]|uniref:uncharacterized protein LOC111709908 n=1 Tax=Eurytemora carolleeae TaxID=1294199 RepID=UPI000C75D264|nr:uncharacterized protein LOC111709908 [Eurytemora carolleeae]|eukprot:XP_023339618.1 uncharacterized protein LOC111709908 [Eurytemora affinis]